MTTKIDKKTEDPMGVSGMVLKGEPCLSGASGSGSGITSGITALALLTVSSILGAAKAGGDMGAPGGVIYAGLMTLGCSLEQYQQLMDGMVANKLLVKNGDCYLVTLQGEVVRQKLAAAGL